MQAFQSAPKAWPQLSVEGTTTSASETQPSPSLAHELRAAVDVITQRGAGLGDAFVFGRCPDDHELAISKVLPGEARVFACVEAGARVVRGRTRVDTVDFDDLTLERLRSRHQIRRVSVAVVADDFAWSLGRVVHGLRGLFGPYAALLVAGRQAALLESLWLEELRVGQHDFDVDRMDEPASSWARFTLRRRQYA